MPMSNFPWSELLTGGGAAAATQLANLLTGRKAREVKALGDAIQSVSDQLNRTDKRLEHVEAKHEDCERNLAAVRAEITRLMNEPVAVYLAKPPGHE